MNIDEVFTHYHYIPGFGFGIDVPSSFPSKTKKSLKTVTDKGIKIFCRAGVTNLEAIEMEQQHIKYAAKVESGQLALKYLTSFCVGKVLGNVFSMECTCKEEYVYISGSLYFID